jgi:hypothetical protein
MWTKIRTIKRTNKTAPPKNVFNGRSLERRMNFSLIDNFFYRKRDQEGTNIQSLAHANFYGFKSPDEQWPRDIQLTIQKLHYERSQRNIQAVDRFEPEVKLCQHEVIMLSRGVKQSSYHNATKIASYGYLYQGRVSINESGSLSRSGCFGFQIQSLRIKGHIYWEFQQKLSTLILASVFEWPMIQNDHPKALFTTQDIQRCINSSS